MTNWINSSLEPQGLTGHWVTFGYVGGALIGAILAMLVVAAITMLAGIPV